MKSPFLVIKKPVVTEKSMANQQKSVYTFIVAPESTKPEVKFAVEKAFNVKVTDVRTMRYAGKAKRMGKHAGRRPSWKKAVVTLAEGDSIELFEGV